MRHTVAIGLAAAALALAAVEVLHGSGDSPPADAAAPGTRGPAVDPTSGSLAAAPLPPEPSPERRALLDAAPRPVVPGAAGRAPRSVRGLVAKVRAGVRMRVHDQPGGRSVGSVGDRTRFGSRTALTVFETRADGRWIGVATDARPAGSLGWIRVRESALDWYRTDRSLHVDLSERRMELRDRRRVLRSATVGVGRPATPTPTGRFGVTDRLLGGDFGWWYGCCIVAFTGVQPHLPPGWQGGNRIAVHGTTSRATIGTPSSAGCLRAADAVLKRLMTELPLGAPVYIQA